MHDSRSPNAPSEATGTQSANGAWQDPVFRRGFAGVACVWLACTVYAQLHMGDRGIPAWSVCSFASVWLAALLIVGIVVMLRDKSDRIAVAVACALYPVPLLCARADPTWGAVAYGVTVVVYLGWLLLDAGVVEGTLLAVVLVALAGTVTNVLDHAGLAAHLRGPG